LALRKEGAKKDGTMPTAGEILGVYKKGDKVLIVEDAVLSANSVIEFAGRLRKVGLEVTDVLAMVDVGQGAIENLRAQNICLHAMFTWKDIYDFYKNKNLEINPEVQEYLEKIFNK
jgi:orotate phosphoribosyltransferase